MMTFRNAASGAIVLLGIASLSFPAMAGGFSKTTGGSAWASGSSTTSVQTKSRYAKYKSRTWATANTYSLFNGKVVGADADSGNHTEFKVRGSAYYKQWKRSKAKVYAKNKNVMAKARSENTTHIYVNGKLKVVSKEVARAIARHTPIGTHAASDSEAHISVHGSGFISGSTSTSNKASVRVKH